MEKNSENFAKKDTSKEIYHKMSFSMHKPWSNLDPLYLILHFCKQNRVIIYEKKFNLSKLIAGNR